MGEIKVCLKEKLGLSQTKVNGAITNEGGFAKVLTLIATPCVNNVEVNNAETRVSGEVHFEGAGYLENGDLVGISSSQNFAVNFENAKITPESQIEVICSTVDGVNSSIVNGEISTAVVLNCDFYAINSQTINNAEAGEDVFVKEVDFEANYLKDKSSHNFVVSTDIEQPVISLKTAAGVVKNVTSSEDYFTVDGEVVVNVFGGAEQLKNTIKTIFFSEEIACQGMTKEDVIQCRIKNCGEAVVVSGDNKVTLEIPFTIDYCVCGKENVECIADAYCLTREVKLITQSVEQTDCLKNRYFEETIMTTSNVSEQVPPVDKVLAIAGENINVINSVIKNEELTIEGVASVNVVYKGEEDEKEVINSVIIDIPFTLNVPMSDVKDTDNVCLEMIFGELSAKARKGQLEIVVGVKGNCNITRNKVGAIVTDFAYGEEKLLKNVALEIYVAQEGQTLWDVGKYLNISTEESLNQNSEVALPLMGGEKLVVYRSLSI